MPSTAGLFGLWEAITPGGRRQLEAGESEREALQAAIGIAARQQKMAEEQFGLARGVFEQTGGLRQRGVAGLEDFLRTGALPTGLDVGVQDLYRTGREDLEDQYRVARRNVLATTPGTGGQLTSELADLETGRAREAGRLQAELKAQVEQPLRQALFSSGLSTGFGGASTGMTGMQGGTSQVGQAGQTTGQVGGLFGQTAHREQQALLQREAAKKEEVQNIGEMAGMAFGGGI